MHLKFFTLLLIVLGFYLPGFTQVLKIEGIINDEKQQGVAAVTIQLKDARDLHILSYCFANSKGFYTLKANVLQNQKYYLIASCLGFKRDTLIINGLNKLDLRQDFTLHPDENQLDEITVKALKPAIEVLNDTTKYKTDAFTSAEDRSLQDVIKKMPGMTVSDDGTIYFKNKQVSKVLLEGDDLTSSNYKTITQNLKPDFVDEVQAIENWVEDDLLKGIINSDDIVLNLVLKDKRKQKIIGSSDIGYGTNNRKDISVGLIGFVNKTKAYSFIRTNDIGISQENIYQLAGNNRNLIGDGKLIDHQIYSHTPFNGNSLALNNSLNGSISTVTRLGNNFKVNLSFYGLRNKLYNDNTFISTYFDPANATIRDEQSQQSNNKHYQTDLIVDYLLTKNARLVTKFNFKLRPQNFSARAFSTYNNIVTNDINHSQSDLLTNCNFESKFTLKANSNSALILNLRLTNDVIDQNYNLNSDLYKTILAFSGSNLNQLANIKYVQAKFDIQALSKNGNHFFYGNFGVSYNNDDLKTNIVDAASGSSLSGFTNNRIFISNKIYFVGKYTFVAKKFMFYTLFTALRLKQKQNDVDSAFFRIEPEVSLQFKVARFQDIDLKYNYKNVFTKPIDYYAQPILVDIRTINVGMGQLNNFRVHNVNFNYSNNEFSDDYLSFNLSAAAHYYDGGLITNNFFENTIYYAQKMAYKGSSDYSATVSFQKTLLFLSSKFSISYTPSLNHYYNKVDAQISDYSSFTNFISTGFTTGFKLPVNFTFDFQFQNTTTRLGKNKINQQDQYKYGIQSRYKLNEKLFSLINLNIYKIGDNNYKLLNTELQYKPLKGIFSYSILGKNLTNIKEINNFFVNNVSESKSSTGILGRYILGSISIAIK